jgi:hypothetical protein
MKKLTLCFLLLSLIYQTNAQNDLKVYYTVDSLKVLLSNGLNFSTELIYNGSSYYRLHYTIKWNGKNKNGFVDGKGTLKITSNQDRDIKYEGVFTNGIPNGLFKIFIESTKIKGAYWLYEGNLENDRFEGYGTLTNNPDDYKYIGNFHNSYFDGRGKYIPKSGKILEGNFYFNKFKGDRVKDGFASIAEQDNSYYTKYYDHEIITYEGNFKGYKKSGQGKQIWPDKMKYIGEWDEDYPTEGTMYYPDSSRYKGHFYRWQKDGYGIMYYLDGRRFEGQFKENEVKGSGIMYYSDGSRYEGEFNEDKIIGSGIMYYADGSRYEGEVNNRYKTGIGKYYDSNNLLVYDGFWFLDNKVNSASFSILTLKPKVSHIVKFDISGISFTEKSFPKNSKIPSGKQKILVTCLDLKDREKDTEIEFNFLDSCEYNLIIDAKHEVKFNSDGSSSSDTKSLFILNVELTKASDFAIKQIKNEMNDLYPYKYVQFDNSGIPIDHFNMLQKYAGNTSANYILNDKDIFEWVDNKKGRKIYSGDIQVSEIILPTKIKLTKTKQGKGTLYIDDFQTAFSGTWNNDKFDDTKPGSMKFANGEVQTGYWIFKNKLTTMGSFLRREYNSKDWSYLGETPAEAKNRKAELLAYWADQERIANQKIANKVVTNYSCKISIENDNVERNSEGGPYFVATVSMGGKEEKFRFYHIEGFFQHEEGYYENVTLGIGDFIAKSFDEAKAKILDKLCKELNGN